MTPFYAIRTATRQEKRALTSLRDLELVVYCPMETRLARHARKEERKLYPLFAGYVFARLADKDVAGVNQADGVHQIVGAPTEHRRGQPIPEQFIAWLAFAEEYGAFNRTWVPLAPTLSPGRRVAVTSGPFAGEVGQIIRVEARKRFKVLLDAFGGYRTTVEAKRLRAA